MRVFTLCELMRFSRAELKSMADQVSTVLPTLPEGSLDRRIALINFRNIHRELIRRDMVSGPWR